MCTSEKNSKMNTIDWNSLSFDIIETKSVICYSYSNGKWGNMEVLSSRNMEIDLFAEGLHYGQSCFEGLKAFKMKDGKIRLFRPDLNAVRLQRSCEATSMPAPSTDMFLEGCYACASENKDFIPPHTSQGSLYIRPFVFATSAQLGLSPSQEYKFIILCSPVGSYYSGGIGKPVKSLIKYGFDRAAPNGTVTIKLLQGSVKVAGNYAPVLGPSAEAKKEGYTVLLFLDSKNNEYVEEFGTSNFAAIAKDENGKPKYITPLSSSILPSVTNRSLLELAFYKFGWKVERRKIKWSEVLEKKFDEVAACGTAVVLIN